jgi:uncharacterized protein
MSEPALAATPAEERLPVLDIVRGVALLGILVMNIPAFGHSLFASVEATEIWHAPLDRIAALLREALFAGKFNSMFSLLFGIGFTLQFGRLQASRPADANRIYLRRLAVLLALGLLHAGLLWSGDVLLVYALLGLALLLLRRMPDRALWLLIAMCLLYPAASTLLRPVLLSPADEAVALFEYQQLEASNNVAFAQGSFTEAARETLRIFHWAFGTLMGRWSYASFYAQMAGALLIGVWIGRRHWVQRIDALQPQLRLLQRAVLAVAIGTGLAQLAVHADGPPAVVARAEGLAVLLQTVGRCALMLFYVTTLARLAGRPGAQRFLAPFAAAGRMPLSNYLLQTALGTFIFYGWGLGLWGRLGPAAEVVLAFALFLLVQLPLSVWWQRHWRYGPLEWAWRVATYGVRVPLRREPA